MNTLVDCVLNITYAAIGFCADITSDSIYPTQQKQKYTQTEIKDIWKDTYQLEIFNILTNGQFIWLKTPELNLFYSLKKVICNLPE